ncbi:dihydroneopterin triphosphate diphosphatase [Gulbenkiania mobilis]|uniref:dihydroneopterin triphosphate diphosphatase n=1 Tax=Gulbenkiania mobilis TaxID=397457 RepID=UPI0006BBEE59|nr:dihydroneopterin triphosphate diphosphatase [Gulbenkiania mobilis]
MNYKQPQSVLVVVYTPALDVLLIERADRPGFWQSVTGSREGTEPLAETAARELGEETGLDAHAYGLQDWQLINHYEIYPHWRHRYAPGVTHNDEHVFGVCVPAPMPVTLAPAEHLNYVWLPWDIAANRVFSPSNAAALRSLPARAADAPATRPAAAT